LLTKCGPTTRRVIYHLVLTSSFVWGLPIAARKAVYRPLLGHSSTSVKSQLRNYPSLSTVLTPPAVFAGIFITLWIYKCCMMVAFQSKIIYMPSVPLFSRSDLAANYARQCQPVEWCEQRVRSLDGTSISLLVGAMKTPAAPPLNDNEKEQQDNVIVAYFQG